MMSVKAQKIFKESSTTYYFSSLFFDELTRDAVTTLYAYVRYMDNLVDCVPQKSEEFYVRKKEIFSSKRSNLPIIENFKMLCRKYKFDSQWVKSFLKSMEMDLRIQTYQTLDDTLEYIYGSAEVIGLFLAKILNLPKESYTYAQLLGRSMQYINFIRDIHEDDMLGRIYFPKSHLDKFKLKTLSFSYTKNREKPFEDFITYEIDLYRKWQRQAEEGFKYIPKNFRIPIKTASDMYKWTARKIENNPFIVYDKKVKPHKIYVIIKGILNSFTV